MSARPPVRVNSHFMILKSFQPQLQLIVVNNGSFRGCCRSLKTLPSSDFTIASVHARHDHERRSSRSGSSSSVPQWTNAVNISSSESSVSFQRQQRYWLVLSRHSQPWKAGRDGQQRCGVGRSATQASFTPWHQSDQSFSRNRSGCLCKHATANLRAKLKSPKLSSWEDSSPSRSTATTKSAVKARHDPFRLAPFRTRTHALPVFMQVIYSQQTFPYEKNNIVCFTILIILPMKITMFDEYCNRNTIPHRRNRSLLFCVWFFIIFFYFAIASLNGVLENSGSMHLLILIVIASL